MKFKDGDLVLINEGNATGRIVTLFLSPCGRIMAQVMLDEDFSGWVGNLYIQHIVADIDNLERID